MAARVDTKRCEGDCGATFPHTREFFRITERRDDGTQYLGRYCHWCYTARQARSQQRGCNGGTVPIDPFREWLAAQAERISADDRVRWGDGITELGERIGSSERHVYRMLHESRTVSVDVVDRSLCRVGSETLMDLYPWLYAYDEEEKDGDDDG